MAIATADRQERAIEVDSRTTTPEIGQWTRTGPIQARFPNAGRAGSGYCVGGAFVGYYGKGYVPGHGGKSHAGNPNCHLLGRVIRGMNRHLTRDQAVKFASMVIHHNDSGRIREAWQTLELALAY